MKRARPAVADALGNEVVTAYYDDGQVKYTQLRNELAAESYVTYSTAHWYDSDRREKATAQYGTGSLPSPWPAIWWWSKPEALRSPQMNCYAMAAMSWLMLMMVLATGRADGGGVPDMTDNQPTAEPGQQQVGALEISRVFYDDKWQRWSVTAKLTNTSQGPLTIACDGGVSRLPRIVVPPAWVETHRMEDGQWKDITPMMDAIGINHDIDPGQHVTFDAAIPHTAEPGDQLRLVVMGVASEPFTFPAEPASDR